MKNSIYRQISRLPRLFYGTALAFQFALAFVVNVATANAVLSLPGVNNIDVNNPTGPNGFIKIIICPAAFWMFWILIALTVVFILVAAYKYLTSSGDPTKVSDATKTIAFAAVAIVVAFIARVFPLIIFSLFGSNNIGIDNTPIC